MKAIIVDDEKSSRNVLREYLTKYCPGVSLVAEAESVTSAIAEIRLHNPDIVFLDVEMPQGTGFDLLEELEEVDFETVFVTAYDHYAIQAINYSAAFYLLKPVSIDELVSAVEKIQKRRDANDRVQHTQVILDNLHTSGLQQKKIVLPLMEGFEVVRLEDIVACEAHDNFTDFYFVSRPKMMICRTLKFYEELLADSGFMRIHKSHMVNLEHVTKYTRGKGGVITMSNGAEISVSPQKKDDFLEKFSRGR
jgi:two-component system, LytTR family, response regulator